MIEEGLSSHRFAVETAYLYPRAGLPLYAKLAYTLRMARRIWRGGFDTLIAYQSTASILVGIVGWLAGCRLRVVHQTCTPSETPRPLRVVGQARRHARALFRQHRQQRGHLGRVRALSGALPALDDSDRARARRAGADARAAKRRGGVSICRCRSRSCSMSAGSTAQKNQDVLIRALACLPQAHLVLAGAGREGR